MFIHIDYHLLCFDRSGKRLLVNSIAGRWVVPVVRYGGAPFQFGQTLPSTLDQLGLSACPIHDALVPNLPGVLQAYCALEVKAREQTSDGVWMDAAVAMRTACILDVQRLALGACLARLEHPSADFDCMTQVESFEGWVQNAFRQQGCCQVGPRQPLRHTRRRRVTRYVTDIGDLYSKANRASVPHEARVTEALAKVVPGCFAETLEMDPDRGWWLYRGLAGKVLAVEGMTPELGQRIGRSLALVQRGAMNAPTVRAAFGSREVSGTRLLCAARTGRAIVERYEVGREAIGESTRPFIWAAIAESCHDLDLLPSSVLHCDMWLPNIVDDGARIAFLDAEEACWGPVVLSIWRLLNGLREAGLSNVVNHVVDAYIDEWNGHCDLRRLQMALDSLGVTGRLFQLDAYLERSMLKDPGDLRGPAQNPRVETAKRILLSLMKEAAIRQPTNVQRVRSC